MEDRVERKLGHILVSEMAHFPIFSLGRQSISGQTLDECHVLES